MCVDVTWEAAAVGSGVAPRVENDWENSSHWQENRSMTGNSAGGGQHGEELELNEGQIVTDFRTIQGFSFLLLTNYVVFITYVCPPPQSWKYRIYAKKTVHKK